MQGRGVREHRTALRPPIIPQQLQYEKQKIEHRLEQARGGMAPLGEGPEFTTEWAHYELSARTHAISSGGIGVMHRPRSASARAMSAGLLAIFTKRIAPRQRGQVMMSTANTRESSHA